MISKKILLISIIAIAITTTGIYAGGNGVQNCPTNEFMTGLDFADDDNITIFCAPLTSVLNSIDILELNVTQEALDINQLELNVTQLNSQVTTLQQQTKFSENGLFNIPAIPVNPIQERPVNGSANGFWTPIIVDGEFSSFRHHIVFTNGTIVNIPGPHLLPSFVNSVDMFIKERLANGTTVNYPICSITAGDSVSDCNFMGFNTTVIPQVPTVKYFVDSNAPTNIYSVFDMEGIFSITVTQP